MSNVVSGLTLAHPASASKRIHATHLDEHLARQGELQRKCSGGAAVTAKRRGTGAIGTSDDIDAPTQNCDPILQPRFGVKSLGIAPCGWCALHRQYRLLFFESQTMPELRNSFLSKSFLRSVWAHEYETFKDSDEELALLHRLQRWAVRPVQKETSAQSALISNFFGATWGYTQAGLEGGDENYSIYPAFPVEGAGQSGGTGVADAALGCFSGANPTNQIAQVLVEFKDIKSTLDAPQKRKGNTRSPVKQALDYLFASRKGMFGHEPILPTWAVVTDMNEFRLYWSDRGER